MMKEMEKVLNTIVLSIIIKNMKELFYMEKEMGEEKNLIFSQGT